MVCLRSYTNGHEELAHESECLNSGLKRPTAEPKTEQSQQRRFDDRYWAYSEWTQVFFKNYKKQLNKYFKCSESCGKNGISRRTIYCVDNSNRKLDNRFCEGLPRESPETECNRIPCPEWVYSHWSECSRSCGGGMRIRHASCQNGAGKEVSSHLCIKSEKLEREKCNEHLCTMWKYSNLKTFILFEYFKLHGVHVRLHVELVWKNEKPGA